MFGCIFLVTALAAPRLVFIFILKLHSERLRKSLGPDSGLLFPADGHAGVCVGKTRRSGNFRLDPGYQCSGF